MSVFNQMMADAVEVIAGSHHENDAIVYTTPDGQSFSWDASLGRIRGDEIQEPTGDIAKVMRTAAIGRTADLIECGVTELQRNATFAALGYADWALDLRSSEWGDVLVKLELVRYPIATHRQMERNAAL